MSSSTNTPNTPNTPPNSPFSSGYDSYGRKKVSKTFYVLLAAFLVASTWILFAAKKNKREMEAVRSDIRQLALEPRFAKNNDAGLSKYKTPTSSGKTLLQEQIKPQVSNPNYVVDVVVTDPEDLLANLVLPIEYDASKKYRFELKITPLNGQVSKAKVTCPYLESVNRPYKGCCPCDGCEGSYGSRSSSQSGSSRVYAPSVSVVGGDQGCQAPQDQQDREVQEVQDCGYGMGLQFSEQEHFDSFSD